MRHPVIYDEAILTSRIHYGDADCIVRLFCKEQGRVCAFVKGGMRASKRRGGRLQIPSKARVGLVARTNSELFRLTEIDTDSHIIGLGSSLRAFGFASYVAELIEIFLAEGEGASPLFDVVDDVFRAFADGNTQPEILRAFELKLLAQVGLLPDLEEAVDCPTQKVVAYDPSSGHLLANSEFGSVAFDEEARKSALSLLNDPIAKVSVYSKSVLQQVAKIFAFRLHGQKKGPLKSVEFLKELGV